MDGDTRLRLAARVDDIEPFHVMEVQTAARALEAAGRDIVHMEIGEPTFRRRSRSSMRRNTPSPAAISTTRRRSDCPSFAPRSRSITPSISASTSRPSA